MDTELIHEMGRKMIVIVAFLCMQLLGTTTLKAQANMYDQPAQVTFTNTYVPMSPEQMYLVEAAKVLKEKQMRQSYTQNVTSAYRWLKEGKSLVFLQLAEKALKTGYYSSDLYYNMGIAYYLSNKKWKAKRFLRKAHKEGYTAASLALSEIKNSKQLSSSWFICQ